MISEGVSQLLKSEALSRTVLRPRVTFPRNSLRVTVSLLASSALGMAVAGSITDLGAVFLDLLVILSIVLCPVCMKGSGYRTAIGIGAITILSAAVILVSRSVNIISPEGLSTSTWALIQIAIVKFGYSAYKENGLYPRF